jgi:hypothetical protein
MAIAAGADDGERFASDVIARISVATDAALAPLRWSDALTLATAATDPPISPPTVRTAAGEIGCEVPGEVTSVPAAKLDATELTAEFAAAPGDAPEDAPPAPEPPLPVRTGSGVKAPPAIVIAGGPVTSEPLPFCAAAEAAPNVTPSATTNPRDEHVIR